MGRCESIDTSEWMKKEFLQGANMSFIHFFRVWNPLFYHLAKISS
jgi:hypothetical protein